MPARCPCCGPRCGCGRRSGLPWRRRARAQTHRATKPRFRDHRRSRGSPPSRARRTPSSRRETRCRQQGARHRARNLRTCSGNRGCRSGDRAHWLPGQQVVDAARHRLDGIETPVGPSHDANEKPGLGGVSFAFAMLSVEPRSEPYHGLARAPFTGLRVVATSSVGFAASAEASGRVALSAMPAQPPSTSAPPEAMSPPSNTRRDVTESFSSERQTIT